MINLLNDQQKRKCPHCNNEFIGAKIFEHEKICNEKGVGQQNNNYQNVNQIAAQKDYESYQSRNQQMQNHNYQDPYTLQQQFSQNIKRCEYCDLDFPLEQFNLHIKNCDQKIMLQTIAQSELPSRLFHKNQQLNSEQEAEKQICIILTQYFELREQNGEIMDKGEELVKTANFSIEPFAKSFERKMCKSCNQNFKLDEEILIMKCCRQIYHHICFAEIIIKTINCECGEKIIND